MTDSNTTNTQPEDESYEELVLSYIRKAYETRQNVYHDNNCHSLTNDA